MNVENRQCIALAVFCVKNAVTIGLFFCTFVSLILYNLVFILLVIVFQILIALMLNEIRSKFFKKVSQTIMFLPYFISAVLIGAIAFNILNYGYASAIGVVLMLLCILSVGISNRVFKTDETV